MKDWRPLLEDYGIDLPYGRDEHPLLCLLHDDSHTSLSLNTKKGVWICYAGCGSGSLYTFLEKLSGVSRMQIDSKLRLGEETWELEDEREERELSEVVLPFEMNRVPAWIFEREFTSRTLHRWGCGYNRSTGSLVIPVLDIKKRCVGWVCRQEPGRQPKYLYSRDLRISKLVFGAYNIKSTSSFVCLTEGTLDTIWLDQHSIPSVCIFGLNLSDDQGLILSKLRVGELVLCLDNDEPGQRAMQQIRDKMDPYFLVSTIQIPGGFKDVQDIRDPVLLKSVIDARALVEEGIQR